MTEILCKTCKYWTPPPGPSNAPDTNGMGRCLYNDSSENIRLRMVALEVLEDDGDSHIASDTVLNTSPWFGCTRHEEAGS